MNNLDAMTRALLEKSQKKAEKLIAAAQAEAEQIIAAAEQKAKEEAQAILQDYQLKAQEAESRSRLREKMQMRHLLLAAKQEMVDEVVARTRQRFLNQTQEEWIALLSLLLERSSGAQEDEKPEIVVPAEMVQPVREALGGAYAVKAGQMRSGFIFSFPQYDLNYEGDRLFTHQKERLEREAARCLFDGDDDEGR